MRIRILRENGHTLVIDDATVMIVEDASGNPVSVACEYGMPEAFCVAHVKDKEFNTVLHNLGINRVVIAENLESSLKPPSQLQDLPLIF